jgi:hypothetical protein
MKSKIVIAVIAVSLFASPVIAKNYRLYDDNSKYVGSVREGRIYNSNSKYIGRVEKDRIYNDNSEYKGRVQRDGRKSRNNYEVENEDENDD